MTQEETHLTLYLDFKKREGTLVGGVEAMCGFGCHALVSSSLVTHDVWIWLSCIGIVVIGNAQEKCIGGGVWFRPKSAVGDPEGGDVGCR